MKLDAVKKTVVASALLLSQSLALSPLPVFASGEVRVAGNSIFSIPASTKALNADTVQNNLDNALVAAKDKGPGAVGIVYAKGMPVITLGGYQVVTIDAATAKAAGVTPAVLANKWAGALKASLNDRVSIDNYVAQLSGGASSITPPPASAPAAPQMAYDNSMQAPANVGGGYQSAQYQGYQGYQPTQYSGGGTYAQTPPPGYGAPQMQPPMGAPYMGGAQGGYRQGRVVYAPAGLVIPLSLQTAISTQVAKPGDMIQAQISESVNLGDATIPAGSVVTGTISDAEAGRRLSRSGLLNIKFTRLRTPDGVETPISGHLIGEIGKYKANGQGDLRGEGMTGKLGQTAIRGIGGAGLGAALGTGIGAIAGRSGRATGRGAWSGAAIGGGLGAADMLLRKGRDVTIQSGTQIQLQLDSPATIAGGGYTGNL